MKALYKYDYRDYFGVLMDDNSKQLISRYSWLNENNLDYRDNSVIRELSSKECLELIDNLGFKKNCKISHSNNEPVMVKEVFILDGFNEPYIKVYDYSSHFPDGFIYNLSNCKLVVNNPSKFWHYKYKK